MTLGEEIKARREALGLSQAALGKIVGVSRTMIGLYEKDLNQPRGGPAEKLSKELSIPPERFTPIKTGVIRVDTPTDVHIIPLFSLNDLKGGLAGLADMLAVYEDLETRGLKVSSDFASCFAVKVTDDAMSPDYKEGDMAIVDSSITEYHDVDVLVTLPTGVTTIRHCRFRGRDEMAAPVYDLSTPNVNIKTLTVNRLEPAEFLGVVVEMRRKRYRKTA